MTELQFYKTQAGRFKGLCFILLGLDFLETIPRLIFDFHNNVERFVMSLIIVTVVIIAFVVIMRLKMPQSVDLSKPDQE
jgi:hypothetical protein